MPIRVGVYEHASEPTSTIEVTDLIGYFALYRKNGSAKKLALRSALVGDLRASYKRRK